MSELQLNQVCYATLGPAEPWRLENYLDQGGYEAWQKILAERMPRDAIIEEVKDSGLRGRGWSGFPGWAEMEFHAQGGPSTALHRL